MSRFPPIPLSSQTPEQEVIHNEIDAIAEKEYGSTFTLRDSEGALIGPFAPLIYTPTLGRAWAEINLQIMKIPAVSLRERELAIFAVLSYSPAAYALYAHERIGEKAGFSPTQMADALEGKMPKDLSEREEATYVLAGELARLRGPLSEESFDKACKVLGREGVAALIHLSGCFLYSTVLLNAANVPVPDGEKI